MHKLGDFLNGLTTNIEIVIIDDGERIVTTNEKMDKAYNERYFYILGYVL